MKRTRERIHLVVAVDIYYEEKQDRKFCIRDAKECVTSCSNLWVAEPRSAKLLNPKAPSLAKSKQNEKISDVCPPLTQPTEKP